MMELLMSCYEPGETIPAPLPSVPSTAPPRANEAVAPPWQVQPGAAVTLTGAGMQVNVGPGGLVMVNPTVLAAGAPLPGAAPAAAVPAVAAEMPDWYAAGLQHAALVRQRRWQPATNAAREKAWSELDGWARARLGRAGEVCSATDLLVYLTTYWLGAHGRQVLPNGATAPAPSTLETTLAHLSTRFAELGRRGDWEATTGKGNPCSSMEVRNFKAGYANLMQEAGFRPKAVPPLPEWKLLQLLAWLEAEADAMQAAGDRPWHVEALLRRDAAMVALLWESCRRPAEVGGLQQAAVSAAGGVVRGQAASSKMCHASRGRRLPRPIEVQGFAGERLCQLLGAYQESLERHGQALGGFLFSPLLRDGSALDGSKGLGAAAMTKRLIEHLRRLGLYEGESVYSLKRGAMQHAFFVQGRTLEAVGEAADIDTAAVVQLYVDPTRHL